MPLLERASTNLQLARFMDETYWYRGVIFLDTGKLPLEIYQRLDISAGLLH